MRNPKSGLAFSAAALFCVVAVITRIAGSPTVIPIVAIVVAAIALFVGLNNRVSTKLVDQPVVFTQDQVEQLKELKSRGQEAAAIRQAQLWSRGSSNESVADAVRKL
ncbi:hypothetical protein N24_2443 [Corynebacterium suranareeae]|uniref:Uncharacterized protein n=1 Tax=Corynebacterium suranareeae TaxID=2506452 RepID=A0A160PSN6_9CORY|nr:hypothetical protein [Corynebacterium suranareeae]BAU96705.1 hypothetical protein N24_2443 [Corynebacterium suranareeae]